MRKSDRLAQKFGILLGAAILGFTGGIMVSLPTAYAETETVAMDMVSGYCFVVSYGGTRRKYCI